jgi:hypothetical protein
MKKLIFVCSHLHSGSSDLCSILDENPKIQICKNFEKQNYSNPLDIFYVTSASHKTNNKSALYLDHLLFNYQLSMKAAYSYCKFIYVIRNPEPTINLLVTKDGMTAENASRYYSYRLRRLYEMSKKTPGSVLLTWDDLQSGNYASILESYLSLNQPLVKDAEKFVTCGEAKFSLGHHELEELENKYQKYLYYLKNEQLMVP